MSIIRKFAAVALSLTTAVCALPALSAPVQAATLPPLIHIDTPAPNAAVSQSGSSVPIAISGWAAAGAKITSVTATFDGHAATGSALNLSRPDVAKKYPAYPYAKTSGFKANMLVVPSIADGFHTITVTAKAADGKTFSATVRVQYHKLVLQHPLGTVYFYNAYYEKSEGKIQIQMVGDFDNYKIIDAKILKIIMGGDIKVTGWSNNYVYFYCVTNTYCKARVAVECIPTKQIQYFEFLIGSSV